MAFTRVDTTGKLQTQWYALRAGSVVSSSCRTMFVLRGFSALVKFILGETGVPYEWEYGDRAIKS